MISRILLVLSACAATAGIVLLVIWPIGPFSEVEDATDENGFAVLTDEEVEQYQSFGPPQPDRSIQIKNSDGPEIKVISPSGYALASPVDFDILLEPRDGAGLDVKSLRIEYRLGPAWVNLTNRVMKHASVQGNRFRASKAELPKGDHLLRISVADTQARTTRATVKFSIIE